MKVIDQLKKSKAADKLKQAQDELDAILAQEKEIEEAKQARKRKRQYLETNWKTRNIVYGLGKGVHVRLAMWVQLSLSDPRAFKAEVIEAYGLTELFQFFQEHAKKPVSPPKFDDEDNLITE